MQDGSIEKIGGPSSEVEADETFIGQKAKNMHKSRKLRLQRMRNEIPNHKYVATSPGNRENKITDSDRFELALSQIAG